MNEPLNETERQELERLREAVQARSNDQTLRKAQSFAGFIWGNTREGRFNGDDTLLWDALPRETQELIIDFVRAPKKSPYAP